MPAPAEHDRAPGQPRLVTLAELHRDTAQIVEAAHTERVPVLVTHRGFFVARIEPISDADVLPALVATARTDTPAPAAPDATPSGAPAAGGVTARP